MDNVKRGRGRPAKPTTEKVGRFPLFATPDVIEEISATAERCGMNRSAWVLAAVQRALAEERAQVA